MTVNFNGTTYFYAVNLQGDVIAILDAEGNAVVTYSYDAWGNPTGGTRSSTDPNANALYQYNPLRYRGYVYDFETGLYYLQSRYYNPQTGRFLNGDGYVSTGTGFVGNNMFAYCINNPVNMYDSSGKLPDWADYYSKLPEKVGGNYYHFKNATSPISASLNPSVSSLPRTGDPNSSQILLNPDGTIKQKRWFGPDGQADRDRDYNHGGDHEFPHDHEWKNGSRGEDHLPPSPDYEFSWEPVIGVGAVVCCCAGIIYVAVNDSTGVGVVDDFLFGPLGIVLTKGIDMMFK